MLYSNDRQSLRRFYTDSWKAFKNKQPLEPMAQLVVTVIGEHPEYHALIEKGEDSLNKDYLPENGETNPFLHMGLHLAIREQVSSDRPAGIRAAFHTLKLALGDPLQAEHCIMDCLAEALWMSQKYNQLPDEAAYLACVQQRIEAL
jgi:hypothetical protein